MIKKAAFVLGVLMCAAVAQAHAAAYDEGISSYYERDPYVSSYTGASGFFGAATKRFLTDPLFIPRAGQLTGSTSFVYHSLNYEGYGGATNAHITSVNSDYKTLSQSLEYGISDRFSVGLSGAYQLNTVETEYPQLGSSQTAHNNGFSNPTLNATWRIIDQAKRKPVDVDLLLAYSPNVISAKSGVSGNNGNASNGRHVVSFGAAVGREMKKMSLKAQASGIYNGECSYQFLGNDHDYRVDSAMSYNLTLSSQVRFTNRFSLNAGMGYTLADDTNGRDLTDSSAATWKTTGVDTMTFNAALNFHFVPNRLVGSLAYTHTSYDDATNTYTDGYVSKIKDKSMNSFGARLIYSFNK